MLLTCVAARPEALQQAVLTLQIFLTAFPLLLCELLLAVLHSTEEWLLAIVALEEGALGKSEFFWGVIERVAWGVEAWVVEEALTLGDGKGLMFYFGLKLEHLVELFLNQAIIDVLDRCLATWAAHESE